MTVRGSDAAVPADDDAWNQEAQQAFESALPVIVAEVFDEARIDLMPEAICDGAEELVPDLAVTMHGFDLRRLAGCAFRERLTVPAAPDPLAMLDLRPGRPAVRIPLRH